MFAGMNTVLARPWTTVAVRAWRGRQEVEHARDRQRLVPISGTSIVRQRDMRRSRMALLPTARQAGVLTVPAPGVSCPQRSLHQGLAFGT